MRDKELFHLLDKNGNKVRRDSSEDADSSTVASVELLL